MWHEVRCTFDLLPDPAQVKSRLLAFLAARSVPNIVESYYDGLSADVSPEAAGQAVLADSDGLPLVIYCETKAAAEEVVRLISGDFLPVLTPVIRPLSDTASLNAWSEGEVFSAGRFEIRPAGQAGDSTGGIRVISIRPGEAFGSGKHVTTLAMLRAMDKLAELRGPDGFPPNVLDIGTGNGVLLIAAAFLGARSLTGTDLSAEIIAEARENLALNAVRARTVVTDRVPEDLPPQHLLMANIPIAALRPLIPRMTDVAAPEALFLLAGFTREDAVKFQTELALGGLSLLEETEERGWSALLLRRN